MYFCCNWKVTIAERVRRGGVVGSGWVNVVYLEPGGEVRSLGPTSNFGLSVVVVSIRAPKALPDYAPVRVGKVDPQRGGE